METQEYPHQGIYNALSAFYSFRQHKHQTNSDYLTKFKNLVKILEHYGGAIALHPALIRLEAENTKVVTVVTEDAKPDAVPSSVIPSTPAKAEQASFVASSSTKDDVDPSHRAHRAHRATVKPAKDRYIAYCFLHNLDVHRYESLLTMLLNQYMLGNDEYPSDLTQAYGMLVNYKLPKKSKPDAVPTSENDDDDSEEDMKFLQHSKKSSNNRTDNSNKAVPEQYSPSHMYQQAISLLMDAATAPVDGSSVDNISFDYDLDFCCCTLSSTSNTNLTQNFDHIFSHIGHLDSNWILLDTQSTVHLFKSSRLVTNIQSASDGSTLTCFSNGGSHDSSLEGIFGDFGTVWHNPDAIANILSFASVSDKFQIDFVQHQNAFFVTLPSGFVIPFICSSRGLYFHEIRWKLRRDFVFNFVNTVNDNIKLFSPRQVKKTKQARELYILMGRPSPCVFSTHSSSQTHR